MERTWEISNVLQVTVQQLTQLVCFVLLCTTTVDSVQFTEVVLPTYNMDISRLVTDADNSQLTSGRSSTERL